jgi:hypothetical protein
MFTIGSISEFGYVKDGMTLNSIECYIEETEGLAELPRCAEGSKALNRVNGDLWILLSNGKWGKFCTSETYTPPIEITWDGDIEGKTVIKLDDNVYMCKVSDKVFDYESIDDTSIETTSLGDGNVSTVEAVCGDNVAESDNGGVLVCKSGSYVVGSSNAGLLILADGSSVEVPESGTYFMLLDDENFGFYTSRLTKEAVIA